MRKGDIDRFFREVSKKVRSPLKVYLTGGVASWFWGGRRPTRDIDFGLRTARANWQKVEKVLQEVSQGLGIPIQYSEDIGRWGMIGVSDYTKEAKLYKRLGKVSVYLLSLPNWSIGKIQRYYQSDVDDLVAVFKSQKPHPKKLAVTWARALRESPPSSAQILFVKTVGDFLRTHGQEIWGVSFDPEKYFLLFRRATSPR